MYDAPFDNSRQHHFLLIWAQGTVMLLSTGCTPYACNIFNGFNASGLDFAAGRCFTDSLGVRFPFMFGCSQSVFFHSCCRQLAQVLSPFIISAMNDMLTFAYLASHVDECTPVLPLSHHQGILCSYGFIPCQPFIRLNTWCFSLIKVRRQVPTTSHYTPQVWWLCWDFAWGILFRYRAGFSVPCKPPLCCTLLVYDEIFSYDDSSSTEAFLLGPCTYWFVFLVGVFRPSIGILCSCLVTYSHLVISLFGE